MFFGILSSFVTILTWTICFNCLSDVFVFCGFPCKAAGWDCDISWPYSLTFLIRELIIVANYNYEKVKTVKF